MAHAKLFGDAYQYSHRVLLGAIAPAHKWMVHPMLFRSVCGGLPGGGLNVGDYAQFLGLTTNEVLPEVCDGRRLTRQTLVADVEPYSAKYLFLDPDTGIDDHGEGDTSHVSGMQLAQIARNRRGNIVLVHDHSYRRERGAPQDRVYGKIQALWQQHRLYGAAIIVRSSPLVCYVLVSTMNTAVDLVIDSIHRELPIPDRLWVH